VSADVDLRDDGLRLGRYRLDRRLHRLARATPVGVEVHQHETVRVDEFREVGLALDLAVRDGEVALAGVTVVPE